MFLTLFISFAIGYAVWYCFGSRVRASNLQAALAEEQRYNTELQQALMLEHEEKEGLCERLWEYERRYEIDDTKKIELAQAAGDYSEEVRALKLKLTEERKDSRRQQTTILRILKEREELEHEIKQHKDEIAILKQKESSQTTPNGFTDTEAKPRGNPWSSSQNDLPLPSSSNKAQELKEEFSADVAASKCKVCVSEIKETSESTPGGSTDTEEEHRGSSSSSARDRVPLPSSSKKAQESKGDFNASEAASKLTVCASEKKESCETTPNGSTDTEEEHRDDSSSPPQDYVPLPSPSSRAQEEKGKSRAPEATGESATSAPPKASTTSTPSGSEQTPNKMLPSLVFPASSSPFEQPMSIEELLAEYVKAREAKEEAKRAPGALKRKCDDETLHGSKRIVTPTSGLIKIDIELELVGGNFVHGNRAYQSFSGV